LVRAIGALLLIVLPLTAARAQAVSLLVERELLTAHNVARVQVGSPPLVWSDALARVAQDWADRLMRGRRFEHQADDRYGENLFLIAGGTVAPTEVVHTWLAELRDYDHNTNSCHGVCGHYTQVIWRATRAVGCGTAFDGYRQIWVCEYEPPGNIKGQSPY